MYAPPVQPDEPVKNVKPPSQNTMSASTSTPLDDHE
jgi:hypothetical protein